ncbi:MAG: xanthine dehydrogenase family protein molybdopterin-binding subunit [Anaerolineae bacterium]|jgi:CO/xanthine dehydrogenase Mo-binding subunit|nr:xanthine dehydrogenase family protein molybdopterin-binding subunit [Anaerolineae bacterium]
MADLKVIGKQETQNVDGLARAMGEARYVCDMHIPGMLIAKALRSSLPHARIAHLDVAPALQVPGVRAVITQADFEGHSNFGWPIKDAYALAYERVRHVGEAIAVVAAETEAAAQAGVAAIKVTLEPLPVVSDMHRALDPDAPIIPQAPPTGKGNLCDVSILRNGDPAPILAECPVILDENYLTPHQEHVYLETEGALAIPEPDGSVTIFSNNQSPFINRDTVAALIALPPEQVRVIQPPIGGTFGGKDDVLYQTSAQVARLAMMTGRPVRLIFERTESMIASYKRQAMDIHLRLGADEQGNLQAAQATMLADSGAYASMTSMAAWRATMHAAGAYRYRAVHVDTQVLYTNNGYSGAFRGFGNTAAVAAIEIAIDELAHRLGRDPIEFRLQNCLRTGDRTMAGDELSQEAGLTACLEWVRERADWDHKRASYAVQPADAAVRRGLGVAAYFHGSGLGGEGLDYAASTIAVEADYSIAVTSGLTDFGQGSRTVFTLIAAETLGVALERVHILRPDTRTALDSGPTVASRSSIIGGNAVALASQKLLHLLTLAAADALQCAPEQILLEGETFIGPSEEPLTFEQVVNHARAMGFQLSVAARWQMPEIHWDFETGTGKPYFGYVFGAQIAEVEVNIKTGRVRVTGIWAAHDGGKILYPRGAMGQMYGAIAMGLGFALMEGYRFENALPQTTNLSTYRIPRATDVPEIEGTFIQTQQGLGPFGAKNLAEPVMVGTAPAIANAVFQATGIRVRQFPITPELLKAKG